MSQMDNTPNFDEMSPEEIMLWMESLAKRQGANEGFTTEADAEVPEIDPDTVVIDEPGYVPYEESLRKPKAPPAAPPSPAPQPMPVMSPPPAPPARPLQTEMPIFSPPPAARQVQPPAPPAVPPVVPPPAVEMPIFSPPPTEAPRGAEDLPIGDAFNLESAMGDDAMAWLQSLAADQDSTDFTLDLTMLGTDLEPLSAASPSPTTTDPQDWLRSIAEEATDFRPARSPEAPRPPAPPPIPALENPASVLDSFALDAGFLDEAVRAVPELRSNVAEDMSLEGIERAIREGVVTPEQMRRYQELQMERASAIPEPEPEEDFDDEAEPAELPDWLEELNPEVARNTEIQQKQSTGALPPLEALLAGNLGAIEARQTGIPDWLTDDDHDSESVETIFDDAPQVRPAIEVDPNDPWVEALDAEYLNAQAQGSVPQWYIENISDPRRTTRVESVVVEAASQSQEQPAVVVEPEPVPVVQVGPVRLTEATLPAETSLRAGERQSVPGWMSITSTQTAVQAAPFPIAPPEPPPLLTPAASTTPDWLRSTDEQPAALLDWQNAPQPVVTMQPQTAAVAPPPTPVVSGTLEDARGRYREGDLNGSLSIYELLVRTGHSLADVAQDLTGMVSVSKNPVAYRVLGDSLMRQGRLQEALDTYRQALNLL